jgi:hypothetical protein
MINWRIYLLGGLLAAMFALSMYIAHLQTEMTKAKKAAEVAKAQSVVSEATTQAVDRVTLTERIVREETINVIREIDALPNGEALVPDDVARIWGDGIDGLHQHANAADGQDSGNAEKLPTN